jgi:hypothetical protein
MVKVGEVGDRASKMATGHGSTTSLAKNTGEKIGVFLKYQCYDQLFSKFCFVLSQKRQFFRKNFRRKYYKNHNIGPWSQDTKLQLQICK